jgi:hypothetical protein
MASGTPYFGLWILIWLAAFLGVPGWHPVAPEDLRLLVFVGAFLGLACFFVGVGVSVSATPLGVILSGRNTYSLSRLQMALWTWLVLSALIGAAVARAWGIGGVGSVSTALSIGIPGNLLAAMGISYFTGFAAPAALSLKSQSGNTPGQVNLASKRLDENIYANGSVIQRPLNSPAKLADVVQGDDLATAGTVDLSKVQQLLITLLLVGVYFVVLLGLFHGKFADAADGRTALPDFSKDLLTLMGLSHAGYLAYKVAPRPQAQSNSVDTPGLRPAPPDRLAP